MFQTSNSIVTTGQTLLQNAGPITRCLRRMQALCGSRTLPAVTVLVSLAVGGCAAMQPDGDESTSGKASSPVLTPLANQSKTLSDGSIRHDTDSARIAQLWSASEKARAENNLEGADQHLRDALSIAPEDPVLWSRAAELKLDLLEPALAENYAVKSNVYAVDNRTLQHRNWLIIEHAREMRGDLLGVRDAHKMVQQLQY